jgi:hypothetical protein
MPPTRPTRCVQVHFDGVDMSAGENGKSERAVVRKSGDETK